MPTEPFNPHESGLLVVFMSPGPLVTLDEFHDWYDTEHVPLRIERFRTFRSAARYSITSSTNYDSLGHATPATPATSWGAFYTVSDNTTFSDVNYTSLRSERSDREAELFTRLGIVDRRIYRLEYDSDLDANITVPRKTFGLDVQPAHDAPTFLVANSVDIKPTMHHEYVKWFEHQHVPMLSVVSGWRRSRRFVLLDNGVSGVDAKEGDREAVPKILGLHEWDNDRMEQTEEYKRACSTEWRASVVGKDGCNVVRRERKTCALYRAWDAIAALQAEPN